MSGKVHNRSGSATQAPPPPPADGPPDAKQAEALLQNIAGAVNACRFLFLDPNNNTSKKVMVDKIGVLAQSPTLLSLQVQIRMASLPADKQSAVTTRIRQEVAKTLARYNINPAYARLSFSEKPPAEGLRVIDGPKP
jgi:hypothetical protein